MQSIRAELRAIALAGALLVPALAAAQNCALCYTQAGNSGPRMIAALRSGILILAIPPMAICLGITWMAYKKRNQFNDPSATDAPESDASTTGPPRHS